MSGIVIVVAVGVFVASLIAFAVTVLMPGADSNATEDRLAELASRRRGGKSQEEEGGSLLMAGGLDETSNFMGKMLGRVPKVQDYLDQAGFEMPAAKFAFICLAFCGAGIGLCVISPVPILLAPILGLVFAVMPVAFLLFKRKKRLQKFGVQIPEALELLGRSLRAGHSLNAGFGLVASEMQDPLAKEFGRCFEEQNLGIPLEEAIEDMASRVPNMDLRFFATAVVLQRQTGGDLSEILDKIGNLIRERLQILGQIQALTGEGRMSGAVLLALPPVLFLVMLKLNYEYIMQLFTDELGRYMLCAGLVTQVIGAIVIKKIITIKV